VAFVADTVWFWIAMIRPAAKSFQWRIYIHRSMRLVPPRPPGAAVFLKALLDRRIRQRFRWTTPTSGV
jgi:hypothetical protein